MKGADEDEESAKRPWSNGPIAQKENRGVCVPPKREMSGQTDGVSPGRGGHFPHDWRVEGYKEGRSYY